MQVQLSQENIQQLAQQLTSLTENNRKTALERNHALLLETYVSDFYSQKSIANYAKKSIHCIHEIVITV